MFTFLHAADLHLDSPLRGLDKYDSAPADEIRNATRRTLENLVATAIEEQVSFVIIAGDLYDGDWRDYNTGLYFTAQMVRLKDAGIPVYLVAGNHDAANRMTKSLPLPGNVTFFSTNQPETAQLASVEVAIHGQSFANQCTTNDLAKNYPDPVPGCFNVGVLHTSLSGREGHESYAPCSQDCLCAKGYDYWALGHVHNWEVVCTEPTIAFAGNPQGRHIREPGARGCLLVTVDDDHTIRVTFRSLDVFRWQHIAVDVTESQNNSQVLEQVALGLRGAQEHADGLPLAVRLELVGQTTIHRSLLAGLHQLTNEIRALATEIGSGNIWVEKLRVSTSAISSTSSSAQSMEGPLEEIITLVNEARSSPAKLGELTAELADLTRRLPPELSHVIQSDSPDWWSGILDEVESRLVTRLRG